MSLRLSHLTQRPLHPLHRLFLRRPNLSGPRNSSSSPSSSTTRARIDRLLLRLPSFLHPYTSALRTAPISHITSFLILHEITAIVPLVGLATTFHYAGWLPDAWVQGKWVNEGVERFGRYFGRKGWFGFTPPPSTSASSPPPTSTSSSANTPPASPPTLESNPNPNPTTKKETEAEAQVEEYVQQKWHASKQGTRILVEVATAYAITKVLLPARILLSVWAAPWFARVVLGRFGGVVRSFRGIRRGRGKAGNGRAGWKGGVGRRGVSGAAGTGGTGGGVVGRGSWKGP